MKLVFKAALVSSEVSGFKLIDKEGRGRKIVAFLCAGNNKQD